MFLAIAPDEVCGQIAGMSVLDVDVADLNGNGPAFRASEDLAFVQSLNNEANAAMFYASTKANPEKICGFAPRFARLVGHAGGGAGRLAERGARELLPRAYVLHASQEIAFQGGTDRMDVYVRREPP